MTTTQDWWMLSDEEIRTKFEECSEIIFIAKPHNCIEYAQISFGGPEISLTGFLSTIGVNPQMIKPVFDCCRQQKLPEIIDDYDQLGSFPLANEPFQELAKILKKQVKVVRVRGMEQWCFASFDEMGNIVQ